MKNFLKTIAINATAVILVVGIVIFVNYIAGRFSARLDLTEDKVYSLAEATQKILNRLEDRLTIKLYFSEDLPAAMQPNKQQIMDTLSEFAARSPRPIIIEFVNPTLNEERENETQTMGIMPVELNVREKDKIEVKKIYLGMAIYYRDKREVIPVVKEPQNLEYALDLSLLRLVRETEPTVAVYMGANEDRYQLLGQLIEPVGKLEATTLDEKKLNDKKRNSLLVVNPVALDKKIVKNLDTILSSGTNIVIFAGTKNVTDDLTVETRQTGLEEWLGDKGVEFSGELLLDVEQNAQAGFQTDYGQIYMPYPFWVKAFAPNMNHDHVVTNGLEETLFPWTNGLITAPEENQTQWQITNLVWSSERSFVKPDESPNVSPQYIQGMTELPTFKSLPLAAILTSKEHSSYGRIFVVGSPYILQDNFLQQSPSNVIFLSNLIQHASFGDDLLGVNSRGKTAHPLKVLQQNQINFVKWGTMIGVPLSAVILGLVYVVIVKKKRAVLAGALA